MTHASMSYHSESEWNIKSNLLRLGNTNAQILNCDERDCELYSRKPSITR